MNEPWFVRFGCLQRPVNLAGRMITAAALVYMGQVFLALDRHSHSVTDMLYAVYLHWGVTFLGWDWIARRASAPGNGVK